MNLRKVFTEDQEEDVEEENAHKFSVRMDFERRRQYLEQTRK